MLGSAGPGGSSLGWALSKSWKRGWCNSSCSMKQPISALWPSPNSRKHLWCDKAGCSFHQALPSTSCSWGKFSKLDNEHWGNNRSFLFSWAVVGSYLKYFMSTVHSKMLWKVCASSWFSYWCLAHVKHTEKIQCCVMLLNITDLRFITKGNCTEGTYWKQNKTCDWVMDDSVL